MTEEELNRQMDKVRLNIFTHDKFSAFYGPLMCSLNFIWDDETNSTAYTDGDVLAFCRDFFKGLSHSQRLAVVQHEIEHVSRLHMIRGETLDPEKWNVACDHVINLDLHERGYDISSIAGVLMNKKYKGMSEEQVYDALPKNGANPKPFGGTAGDIVRNGKAKPADVMAKVMQAHHQAAMSGKNPGSIPGGGKDFIDALLKPVIRWENQLQKYLTDKVKGGRTWRRPNRRYLDQGLYLPSRDTANARLDHLMWFFDVSGSVSKEQLKRFNSEVKYVNDTMKPKKMTIVQFDTIIQKIDVIQEHENYQGIEIVGRGGTSLHHVGKLIDKEQPTAAIIFSDLYCNPMDPLVSKTDVIWIVIDHETATIPFGQAIHIKE